MEAFLRLLRGLLGLLVGFLVSLLPCFSCAGEFIVHPVSVNTSLNSTVNFTCKATGVSFIHFLANDTSTSSALFEKRGFHHTPQTTFNGATRASLSVWAQAINNNTIISCQLVPGDINSTNALLMVQGQLASVGDLKCTFIDGSSVSLSWTAPYTLDDVPITGYDIDDDSDRDRSFNTTDSSFLLSPPDPANPDVCNVTIVSVYALNGAGRGQPNNISFYYQRVPSTTPTTSVIPTINDLGQLSLNISFNTSGLCRGEYPNNISIDILNTDAASICHTFNSSVIATGIYPTGYTLPDTVDRFSVSITWSNEGGQFDSVLFSFGPPGPVTNINSSNNELMSFISVIPSVSPNPSNIPTETPTDSTSSGREIIGIVVGVAIIAIIAIIAITIVVAIVICNLKCNLRHDEGNGDAQLQGVPNDSDSKKIAVPENAQNAVQDSSLVVKTGDYNYRYASSRVEEEHEYGNDRPLPELRDGSKGSAFCGTSQTGKGDWMV